MFTEEQKVMKELIEEVCAKWGISFISLLSQHRRVDEPVGELIERVYRGIEQATIYSLNSWKR